MEIFALLWTEIIIRPMLNTLIVLYVVFFQNMAIAILVFTVIIRFITLPLTLKQLRQMRKMTELQPKMKDVQTKYAGDRTRISQETMKVYRDAGVSPVGCLGPLIIQMPILIGLFRVLIQILYTTPDDLIGYSERVYSWITFIPVHQAVPINAQFLWLDLGAPDPSPIIIPFLVAATTFLQQKMTTTHIDDLHPDYSGIRPKLNISKNGEKDFIITNEADKGYDNFINLIAIESPGLTSSMAIADYIIDLIN